MQPERIAAWLGLLNSGLSPRVLRRLVDTFDGPANVTKLRARDWAQGGLDPAQCERLTTALADTAHIDKQRASMERLHMRCIERGTDEYPVLLTESADPPPVLFVMGDLRAEDGLSVAIVGPRLATPYGLEVTRRLVVTLAPVLTIYSGLALGIDSSAHETTLRASGRTIGVAACGLDVDYPKGNTDLRRRIPQSGALVSCFPPGMAAARHHFAIRNGLLAAMTRGVIVVEASDRSGALVTARMALDEGREVFAVPGDITRNASRGANALIAEGATVVCEPGDVLRHLEVPLGEALAASQASSKSAGESAAAGDLSPLESDLYRVLGEGRASHDRLVAATIARGAGMGELATALLTLELKGLVRSLPGNTWERNG